LQSGIDPIFLVSLALRVLGAFDFRCAVHSLGLLVSEHPNVKIKREPRTVIILPTENCSILNS
jgi:hypothetical protein